MLADTFDEIANLVNANFSLKSPLTAVRPAGSGFGGSADRAYRHIRAVSHSKRFQEDLLERETTRLLPVLNTFRLHRDPFLCTYKVSISWER